MWLQWRSFENLVVHLELGTELPIGLLWAGCVSSWGFEMVANTEKHLKQQEGLLSCGKN